MGSPKPARLWGVERNARGRHKPPAPARSSNGGYAPRGSSRPWKHHAFGVPLWIVGVAMLVAYPISTFVGGLDPID
jgi:hypothetical protein